MKTFIVAVVFFAGATALSAVLFETFVVTATDAYASASVRVDHEAPVDGRLGWQGHD